MKMIVMLRFKILLMTFKAMNGMATQDIKDLPIDYLPKRCLRSSGAPNVNFRKTSVRKTI